MNNGYTAASVGDWVSECEGHVQGWRMMGRRRLALSVCVVCVVCVTLFYYLLIHTRVAHTRETHAQEIDLLHINPPVAADEADNNLVERHRLISFPPRKSPDSHRSLTPRSTQISKMAYPNFSGSYKLVKSENFEDFLAANGANWMVRKMASNTTPVVTIEHDGDNFYIKSVSVRTQEDRFTAGQPYTTENRAGIKMKVSPHWDGDAIVLDNEPEEAGKTKSFSVRREIKNGQLIVTMTVDNVVCTRTFDKA